jgi:hypothetical protein
MAPRLFAVMAEASNNAKAANITPEKIAAAVAVADDWLERHRDVIELGGGGNHLEELVSALFKVFAS